MIEVWRQLGRVLLAWTLGTAIAGAAAYGLYAAGADFLAGVPAGSWFSLALAGFLAGTAAGAYQAQLMKPLLEVRRSWAWATGGGWAVGLVVVVALSGLLREWVRPLPDSYRLTFYLIAAGVAGTAAASGQWLLLREAIAGHPWWLLASGIGWLMAWIVVLAGGLFTGGGEPLPTSASRLGEALLLGGLAGFTIGIEQAIALVGLLAQRAWEGERFRR